MRGSVGLRGSIELSMSASESILSVGEKVVLFGGRGCEVEEEEGSFG